MAAKAPERQQAAALAQRLEALDTATVALTAEPSVDRLLQLIVDLVRPLVAARYAALGIVSSDGQMERFVTSGISDEVRAAIGPLPRGHGLLGVIVSENRTIRVHDVMADDRRVGFPPAHPPMHTFLGTPVRAKGRTIGNLYLTEKEGGEDFSDDDVSVIEQFARFAGIAVHNARLNAELERLAVLAERQRIGQDLHDGVIQSLYGVGLSLEDLGEVIREEPQEAEHRVEGAIDAIHATIRDLRSFIFGLQPEAYESGDLSVALLALAEEFRRTTVAAVELDLEPTIEIAPQAAIHALQIAREALSNIARHAGATDVRIALTSVGSEARLTITDNGRGFDVVRNPGPGHRGLGNMSDRADAMEGSLQVNSSSSGTVVELVIPANAVTSRAGEP